MPSIRRKANCWDNALTESFFATLKNGEATSLYPSKAAAHTGIANHIHGFYNPTRRHSAFDASDSRTNCWCCMQTTAAR